MSAPRPLAASAGTTFFVYGVGTTLAALPAFLAGAIADQIGGELPGGAADLAAPGGAFLFEALDIVLMDQVLGLLAVFGVAVVLSLIVSPWLHMAWLAAIDGPRSTAPALVLGLRRYLPCVGLRLLLSASGLALTVPTVLLAAGTRAALRDVLDVRSADLLFLACLLPTGLLLLGIACLWDLAHASLARGDRGVLDALSSAARALRPRALATYVAFAVLGFLLLGAAHVASVALPSHGAGWIYGGLAIGQLLLLGRAFVRAGWLSAALTFTAR